MEKVHPEECPASSPSIHTTMVGSLIKHLSRHKSGRERKYIYQTSTPCFNYDILFEQFLIQLFHPISRVYLNRKYGHQATQIQFGQPLFFAILFHLFWINGIVFLIFKDYLTTHGISESEVGITVFASIIFRLVVASKYASMTHEEYREFLSCEDIEIAHEYQSKIQLISGWLSIDISFCAHEAKLALKRMGFKLGSSSPPCFEVSMNEISDWKSILGETSSVLHNRQCEKSRKAQAVNIDVSDLMSLIVSACDYKDYAKYWKPPLYCSLILFGIIPGIVRVSCPSLASLVTYDDVTDLCTSSSFFGDGVYANIFSSMIMMNNTIVAFPLNMFFVATILGSLRHQKCCRLYGYLARIDDSSPPLSKCPVLDLSVHTNIRAWVRSRLALHFFGERYYKRVDIYSKLIAMILICLIIWLYAYSLQVNKNDIDGVNELIVDVRYWTVIFLLIFWGTAFGIILSVMADTNLELQQHEILFLLHRLNVREKRIELVNKNKSLLSSPSTMNDDDNMNYSWTQFENHSNKSKPNMKKIKTSKFQKNSKTRSIKGENLKNNISISDMENLFMAEKQKKNEKQGQVKEEVKEAFELKEGLAAKQLTEIISLSDENDDVEENILGHNNEIKDQKGDMDDLKLSRQHISASQVIDQEELDDLMDTAAMILEAQMRVNPRRFLGADASWNLVKSYLAAFGALIGFSLTVAGINYG